MKLKLPYNIFMKIKIIFNKFKEMIQRIKLIEN